MATATGFSLPIYFLATEVCLRLLTGTDFSAQAAGRTLLKMALEDSIRSFDPRQSVDANSQYIEDLIHCSLMTYDADGKVIPGVAVSLPKWKSPKTLEVRLKEGIKYGDGGLLTAADVVATYQSLVNDRSFARSASFNQVTSVAAVDSKTVVFHLKEADVSFISNLVLGILPSKLGSDGSYDPISTPGCGAFRIKSTDVNGLILEENPFFIGPDRPLLKMIEVKIVKNEKTRFAKLQTGELDLVQNSISRDAIKDIEKNSRTLKFIKRSGLKTTYLGFNIRDKIAGNLAVRRAIGLAINRQEIIDLILGGMATPALTMLPMESPYYSRALSPRPLDIAQAQKILDEAGLIKKGEYRFEMSYKTTTDITRISIAKAIASQLKKIGIKLTIEPMEWGRFKQDIDAGRVQMWSLTWVGFKDPDIYRHAFSSKSFPPNGGNRGWYSDQQLDNLLEQGKQTTDAAQRIGIYQEAQLIIDKAQPYVFLWHEDNFAVINQKLKGFKLFADGRYSSLTQAFFED